MSKTILISDLQCWHECPKCKAQHYHIVKDPGIALDEYFQLCKEHSNLVVKPRVKTVPEPTIFNIEFLRPLARVTRCFVVKGARARYT